MAGGTRLLVLHLSDCGRLGFCPASAAAVRSVIVPADVFLTNKKGFPVLSKRHKEFLMQLFRNKVQVVLSGLPETAETETEKYLHYIARLFQSRPAPTAQAWSWWTVATVQLKRKQLHHVNTLDLLRSAAAFNRCEV
ncbi:PRMT5 [Symbiodinium microadriaticum]|nr:PRMT5 [Symbiodinium microadriaticum]